MSLAVASVETRLASLAREGHRDPRTALRRIERDLSGRVIADLVERDHLDRHSVRVLREVRRRLAALSG